MTVTFPHAFRSIVARYFATTSKMTSRSVAEWARVAVVCLVALCAAAPAHATGVAIGSPVMQEVILPMQHPEHGAVDASGNLYIPDFQTGQVYELYAVNGVVPVSPATRTIGTAFGNGNAVGVALDSLGDLYITNPISYAVSEFVAVGGVLPNSPTVKTIITGLNAAGGMGGIAVDSVGDLYFAYSYSHVLEIKATSVGVFPSNPTPINIGASLNVASDVAVDANGNVFACDYFGNAIVEIYATSVGVFPATPTTRTLISGLNVPYAVAVDASGDVYYALSNANSVQELLAVGGSIPTTNPTVVTLASNPDNSNNPSGINDPYGIMLGPNGVIYVDDYVGGNVNEIQTNGINVGGVPVGTTTNFAIQVNVASGVTVTGINYLTQGATNLDFKVLTPDTKTTLCTAKTYSAATTCVVDVAFTPSAPGTRVGAVQFVNGSTVVGTVYVGGSGIGPQVTFGPAVQGTAVSQLNVPTNVVVDGAGNLYTMNNGAPGYTGGNIQKETLSGGTYTGTNILTFGQTYVQGLTIDGAGNIYVSEQTFNTVVKLTPTGTGTYTSSNLPTSGLNQINGVMADTAGNIYICDQLNNRIVKMTPNGSGSYTQSVPFSSATYFPAPYQTAIDASGSIYILNYGTTGPIYKETPNGSGGYTQTQVAPTGGTGIAVDPNGNVYVSTGNVAVYEYIPNGSGGYTQTAIAGNFGHPWGIALDSLGNYYIGDTGTGNIYKFDASDAPSLSFATTTVGSTSTDSPQTVTLTNYGSAALTFTKPTSGNNPSLGGTTPTSYTLSSTGATACPLLTTSTSTSTPQTLAAGASCVLPVSFTPTATSNAATLTIADNVLNVNTATQVINLSGTGVANTKSSTTLTGPTTQPVHVYVGATSYIPVSIVGGTGSKVPTGTITFTIGSPCVGAGCNGGGTISNGTANLSVPASLYSNNYTMTVSYAGDNNNQAASNINVTFVVVKASSAVSAITQTAPTTTGSVGVGVSATFTATVTNASNGYTNTPTGTVQFYNGATALGSAATLNGSGVATLTTTFATAQTASITAVYSGDGNFTGSTSAAFTETVVTPSYTVTANPTTLTVTRGTMGLATLTFTPVGNYQGTATFTCTGLPNFSSCLFLPTTIVFTGNNAVQTSVLQFYTIAPQTKAGASSSGLLWIPATLLGMLLMVRRRKLAVATRSVLMLVVMALAATSVTGCGWGSNNYYTPTGSNSVVVNVTATATAGSSSANLNQAATITITVQ